MEEDLDKVEMQTLLDEMRVLTLKYEKLRDENKFNIFPILRRSHEEVPLHSRFIFELLNPEGTHRKENEFLKSFLETVEIKDFDMDVVKVHREYRNIDILITNRKQAIIIENKLGAEDQNRQLQRYYEQMKNQGYEQIWLIYLSLREDGPSDTSLGDLPENVKKELITISYFPHILKWLEKCIEKSSRKPALRETIIQYENLIKEITGKTMSGKQGKEVYELMTKGDNIHSARTIETNWGYIRGFFELDFWHHFKEIIPEKYSVLGLSECSNAVWDVVNHRKNRNPWYGIEFKLFPNGENEFYLRIERGLGNLYYGITLVSNKEIDSIKEYTEFATELNKFTDVAKNANGWLGYNYFKSAINFEAQTPETLDLINKDKRKKWLDNAWKEIKKFIADVEKVKAEVLDKST